MKKLSLVAALASTLVSVSAFAEPPKAAATPAPAAHAPTTPAANAAPKAPTAPKAAFGTGDFRRDDVARAAGVKPENATVMGLATAGQHTQKANIPSTIRVEAVANNAGPNAGKVTLVKAPTDKAEPAKALTSREAHDMGLVTPKDAEMSARTNGGVVGSDKKVEVKPDGLAGNSYGFKQVAPSAVTTKEFGQKVEASNIRRSVTFTGSGESASFASKTITPPTPASAPAAPPAAFVTPASK